MATYRAIGTGGGSGGTGNRSANISAVAGDHLTCFVQWSGNNNTSPTCTDNQGGTYDLITTALDNTSADIQAAFVRRQVVATTATIAVTPVVGGGSNTSGEVFVIAVSGMTRMGANSVRQSARQQNQTAGVPTPVFGSSALTGNLTITCQGASNGTATALSVPNASWSERADLGQTAGVSNLAISTRDSGFTGTSAAYVSTTSTLWNCIFVELDTSNAGFFGKEQWDVPEAYKAGGKGNHRFALTWIDSLLQTTLQPSAVFAQSDWPNPVGYKRPTDLITWSANLLQGTLAESIAYLPRSPLYVQRGILPLTPADISKNNLLTTTLGAVQAPFKPLDWTNPTGPIHPVSLRGWTSPITQEAAAVVSYILRSPLFSPRGQLNPALVDIVQNLLTTTLGGVQNPFAPLEWSVPRGAAPRTPAWADTTRVQLIGKDTLPFPNRDWPNPRGYVPVAHTWTDSTLRMAGKDTLPFPNRDWPNPRGYVPVIDLKTWVETTLYLLGKDRLPEQNMDWPNPRGYTPLVRDWIDRARIQLIGRDTLPFPNRDWPVPKGYTPLVRDWIDKTRIQLIGQDQLPNLNIQWPNPRGPQHPWQWQNGSLNELLLTFIAPLPFNEYDWPVPIAEIPDLQLRTWLNTVRILLIGQDRLPFSQDNWPVPMVTKPNQWPPLNPFNPNLPPTPPSPDQLRQIIRFAPLAFGGKTHWGR